MRRTRFLLPGVFIIGMLVWPAVSTAAGGLGGPGGFQPAAQAVPNLAMPPVVPGATIGIANFNDAHAFHGAANLNLTGGVYYANDPGSGSDVWITLDVPAGSTIARIDAYSYRVTNGANDWNVWAWDAINGVAGTAVSDVTSPTGTGLIHTTIASFTSPVVNAGYKWNVDLRTTAAGSCGLVGVIYQYFPPTYTLTPIAPTRVYDSRFDPAGKLGSGKRVVNVKNAINPDTGAVTVTNAIPAGAKAISFTITLTQTAGAGNVAVVPNSLSPTVTASTINWTTSNLDIASGSIVTMGVNAYERQICLILGGNPSAATHVIIDVTGYYM